jgi:hypothetical protein
MKRLILFAALCCVLVTSIPVSASTKIVNVSSLEGELTQALRNQVQGLGHNDTIYINFDRVGCDTIRGTVTAYCNVFMSGLGRCKSTVVLDNGSNQPGFVAFQDDSFFVMRGTVANNISVSITDMTFKLKDHTGIWWQPNTAKYAVKIYHANSVNINNVDSYLKNAVCTNFDLRVCSNVTVTNCNITNYNNCTAGGNLWLRGEMHNINVTGNKFFKYGNDETVAVFSRLVDANTNTQGDVTRSNINIVDNEFNYGYDGADKNILFNDMQFSLYSGDASPYSCKTNGFTFSNNRFSINDLTRRAMYVAFNPVDTFSNVHFSNNTFIDNYFGSIKRYYRNEIDVNDLSSHLDTVFFSNNIFKNDNPVVNPSGDTGAAFFLVRGGKICLDGNIFQNNVLSDTAAFTSIGVVLVWCGEEGGDVTMKNNLCQNIKMLARVAAGNGISKFKINADKNVFQGDTKIYCSAVDTLDVNFKKNMFVSDNMNFFLQEFASTGSVVFNENMVYVKTNGGQLMTHWTSAPTSSMHFEVLEVKKNMLRGINNMNDMLSNITNVSSRTVVGNIFMLN